MPSSTSSFESQFAQERLPLQAGPSVWGAILLLTGFVLCAVETGWRWAGHRPSVVDSLTLWSYHRSCASLFGPRTLVLCGASRTLLGFSTTAFRERFPGWHVVQLAVDGLEPRATLEDLAADPQFRGVAIVEIHESAIGYNKGQEEQVKYYHGRGGWTNTIECVCHAAIQARFAVVHPSLNPKRLLYDWWWNDKLPVPSYRQGNFDRTVDADYQRMDVVAHREWRLQRVRSSYQRWGAPPPADWRKKGLRLLQAADTIQKRGGKVVFVRYPTSGEYWELDRKHYPREKYWDTFVAGRTPPAIHFQDLPKSRLLECPDASHLDYRDKALFTNELLDILAAQGVFSDSVDPQDDSAASHVHLNARPLRKPGIVLADRTR